MKLYMVIEHFAPGAKERIYERFPQKGRMLPEGLHYLNSWLEKDGDRCFQLMETNESSCAQLATSRSGHSRAAAFGLLNQIIRPPLPALGHPRNREQPLCLIAVMGVN